MYNNEVCVKSGTSQSRSFYEPMEKGRVTISNSEKGNTYKRIVIFKDGKIVDNKCIENGKTTFHIVYGKYEKIGKNITRFRGSGTGKHGKSTRHEKLFDQNGICHSWYDEEEAKSKISEENLIGSESDCFQIEEIKELKT